MSPCPGRPGSPSNTLDPFGRGDSDWEKNQHLLRVVPRILKVFLCGMMRFLCRRVWLGLIVRLEKDV